MNKMCKTNITFIASVALYECLSTHCFYKYYLKRTNIFLGDKPTACADTHTHTNTHTHTHQRRVGREKLYHFLFRKLNESLASVKAQTLHEFPPHFYRIQPPSCTGLQTPLWPRIRAGLWGWRKGRPPQAPRLRGPRASGLWSSLWVCQAMFSGKLEMLMHAPFKILLQCHARRAHVIWTVQICVRNSRFFGSLCLKV
jgi:hypothetical protein